MQNRRQPRSIRKSDPAPVRIQDRDRFILEALGKMRFLTTTQIAALGFHSRWAAHKRMRKLMDAGLIRVWLRSLNDENVYSIDRAGAKVVRAECPIPRALDGNLSHLLCINQVRIECALALQGIGGDLVSWRSDWELHRELGIRVIPDALFEISWTDGSSETFSLEVDNQSRSTRGFLKKTLGYARSELLKTTLLVVGNDAHWIERYRFAAARTRLLNRVWFATIEEIQARGLAAAIWQNAEDSRPYSLRELSALPYRKECADGDFPAIAPTSGSR